MTAHEISVNLPPTLDPVYSNRIQIAFKEDEVTFIFLHEIPGTNQARAKAIVSISPRHAKSLLDALGNSLRDYETKFGKIEAGKGEGATERTPVENVTMRGYS